MPCLNEAETIADCIGKAQGFLAHNAITGEVLIADNGSTDGSSAIAARLGARVARETPASPVPIAEPSPGREGSMG
jgi:glycosyltransferase involved in cell wall biosynthesis